MTMAINDDIKMLISSIEEVQTDNTMPRNVKEKLSEVVIILNAEDAEGSLRINKALDKIEEIVDDTNLQPYARTQIWNLASILESL
ncbi:hypothetical protein GF345_02845 [Candidatus Woesearchaeota archaeon]|nr:hypothetical protein [Candidatus Woesearchaeota archaeon]